jgi:hypothetical protein
MQKIKISNQAVTTASTTAATVATTQAATRSACHPSAVTIRTVK